MISDSDKNALYRTLIRLTAVTDTHIRIFIPAWHHNQELSIPRDEVPAWLPGKEIGYRFFALAPICADTVVEAAFLANCEHDPRTVAEQIADKE